MTKEQILAQCNKRCPGTLMETLSIEYTEVDLTAKTLTGRMPVTPKVHQPDGVLHGGAMVALAESIGSAAVHIFLDTQNAVVRGVEISANHVKSMREGYVYAVAQLVHSGRTMQLWKIDLADESGALISSCKLTTLSLPKR